MRARLEILLTGLLFGLLASGLILLLIAEPRGSPVTLLPPPTPKPLYIHVTGAVVRPGVYPLPLGALVRDAVGAAGGVLPQAAVDRLNLAAPVADGQQVVVPAIPTASPIPTPGTALPASPSSGLLSLNSATATELETLPGIGPVLASNIIAYREAHGPFARIEDLLRVPGIGQAKLDQIQPFLQVP
ncbi:MAG: ComEA family DNA-binding protein [Anaerolineales bacterium]